MRLEAEGVVAGLGCIGLAQAAAAGAEGRGTGVVPPVPPDDPQREKSSIDRRFADSHSSTVIYPAYFFFFFSLHNLREAMPLDPLLF